MVRSLDQRLAVVRRVSQARAFLKGEPSDWWDGVNWRWRAASEFSEYNSDNAPRFNHHINIFSAGWQILQSAIQTTGIPGSIFTPQNQGQQEDREAARVGTRIIEYERSVIPFRELWSKLFRLYFTDGIALGYTRHVSDAALGMRTESREIEVPYQELEAGYQCFQCNAFTPQGQVPRDENGSLACPECGSPMHAENFMEPEMGTRTESQQYQVPKGAEIVELFGALECPLPWWANKLKDCPYIPIITDAEKESLIQAFPEQEEAILNGYDDDEDITARAARAASKSPQGSLFDPTLNYQCPYGRWWLRPQTFFSPDAKNIREELLKQFPDGAFVQFAGDVVLDAIPEKPEDHLVLFRAQPGDGMFTPSLGQNGVPIQLSVNTAWNMQLEGMELASFAPILIDSVLLTLEGMKNTKARPGEYKSIDVPAGKSLKDAWAQIEVKDMSVACQKFLDEAKKWLEFLIGASPALAGTQMTNVRSFQQANQQKNQALQRLSTPYDAAKEGFSKVDEILVHEFLSNRTEEEFIAVVAGESSDQQADAILLSQAQGRVFARSTESEAIPNTWAQQQSVIDQMFESQNPIIQSWLADPNNAEEIFRTRGLVNWTVPGKSQLDKILNRTIPQLLESAPQQPDQETLMAAQSGQMDPATAQQALAPKPSIQFDGVLDDPMVVIKVIREWAASPAGADAQQRNPQGFENVRLFCEQALLTVSQQQQAQAQPQTEEATASA